MSSEDTTTSQNPAPGSSKTGLVGWYTNLAIKTKILMPIVVAAAAALLIGVLSLWSGAQAAQQTKDISTNNVGGVSALGDMREAVAGMRVAARDTALAVH